MVGQAGIPHLRDLRMGPQVLGDRQRVLAVAAHAQVERAQATEAEPGLVRRQVRAVEHDALRERGPELRGARDGPAHHVAVTVEVLRQRVHDDVRAERGRAHEHGCRERGIDRDHRSGGVGDADDLGDIDDAQVRVRDGLHEDERSRRRAAERRRIGGVEERDVTVLLRAHALEEGARAAVAVLLDDERAPERREQRVERRHPAREARRARQLVELREELLEGGGRRRAVPPIDVAGTIEAEDGVLLAHRGVVEGDALHERWDDGDARARWQRAATTHDLGADAPCHVR